MIKSQEQTDLNSCWNKAKPGERVFVLLERDEAAPAAIRAWAMKRIELGLNLSTDPKIVKALIEADFIESELRGTHGR